MRWAARWIEARHSVRVICAIWADGVERAVPDSTGLDISDAPRRRTGQAIIAAHGPEVGTGFVLGISDKGHLALSVDGWDGMSWALALALPLDASSWYLVGVSLNSSTGLFTLGLFRRASHSHDGATVVLEATGDATVALQPDSWITIGAATGLSKEPPMYPAEVESGAFNGKVASPKIVNEAFDARSMKRILENEGRGLGQSLLSWPAVGAQPSRRDSPSALPSVLVNSPLLAVTGPNWTGRVTDWRLAPQEYDAVWFHDDDLDDAQWPPSFEWKVPTDARSGLYGAHVVTPGGEDLIPFFVRPRTGQPTARVAFLAPVFTYMAYSNCDWGAEWSLMPPDAIRSYDLTARERFASEHLEIGKSLYSSHRDGSGVSHVSWMRPMVDMRLDHGLWTKGGSGREISGDLYLIDWFEARGIKYDVITDADLHCEGADLLASYKVVVTGGHPEYVTEPMIDALETYIASGGRVMYLGGNGFYWVTTVDPLHPAVLEVRRGHSGTRTWTGCPGENHHACTGEPGGLWRHRGRAPQQLTGVGFDGQGDGGVSAPFVLTAAARDPKWSFIFSGVDLDQPIGAFGSNGEGAAGDELDRLDFSLGSPSGTTLLATSAGLHTDQYHRATEEVSMVSGSEGGTTCTDIRADLTYFDNPRGGAVFSTGSIAWSASLSHNGYENSVSRITENVLRYFER